MRKVVLLSLIFALLTTLVFAEERGQFTWSGNAIFGFEVDFQAGSMEGQNRDRSPAFGLIEETDTLANLDFAWVRGGLRLGADFQVRAYEANFDRAWNPRNRIRFSAGYFGDSFGLFARTGNLLNTHAGDRSVANSPMDHLWGYYITPFGLRFDVAYRGEGGSGIWAVSDIVLNQHMELTGFYDGVRLMDGVLPEDNPWNRLAEQRTGLQLNYLGLEGLSVGFMLPFFLPERPPTERFAAADALRHMVIGAAYESGPLGVSFMLGFEGGGGDRGYLLNPDTTNDYAVLFSHVHAGFYFDITPEFTVSGDFAGRFGGGSEAEQNKDGEHSFLASVGLNATYTLDRLSAGLTLKFLDFADVSTFDRNPASRFFFTGGRTFVIEPSVSFDLTNALTLTGDVGFSMFMNHLFMDNEGIETKFNVTPGISWAITPNASVDLGLSLTIFSNYNNFSSGNDPRNMWDPDIRLFMLSRWSF